MQQQDLPLFGLHAPSGATKQRVGHGIRGSASYALSLGRAREQAERYAKALPVAHGWPPFVLVVDVGHVIEVFADFSLTGKNYARFPDEWGFRVRLDDLARPNVRDRLAAIWTDPSSLDPALVSAKVTREIAAHLGELAKRLEARHHPEDVAGFLMRALFTLFAEDVGLLPKAGFTDILQEIVAAREPGRFKPHAEGLWATMDAGGYDRDFKRKLLRFNGGLFKDHRALDLEIDEIGVLLAAARYDWKEVEPAIFGTLLERALEPKERHKLGAHYTPRSYVERLVVPTVIEPLREEWADVQASAMLCVGNGDEKGALAEVRRFHERLCGVRVLDPACGSGNFLYVTLELMKRLEGEVVDLARTLGQDQYFLELDRHTVDPHQFLGLEINPRAAAIADLVLWIGHLQWHFKTRGRVMPAEPVLRNFDNIACRDALMTWKAEAPVLGEDGSPKTRWDGHTFKTHPVTGRAVPDETARDLLVRYVDPMPAAWPDADFIVGNPPFQGGKDLRDVMGDAYAQALWRTHPKMPKSADYVMYWWDHAARLVREGKAERFGLITTNSLPQVFNRRVVEAHLSDAKKPLSLRFAVPDHPWVDEAGGANVRIAMTVGIAGSASGQLREVVDPKMKPSAPGADRLRGPRVGKIAANLRLGADLTAARPLRANAGLCSPGVKLHGAGFIVTPDEAAWLGLGTVPGLENHIRPYKNGRDLAGRPRGVMVIDLYPLKEDEVRERFPKVYQWVLERVRPEREHNNMLWRKIHWWWFGATHETYRSFTQSLDRIISTSETSKHRFFVFLDSGTRPDNMLVNIGLDDAFLAVLSSRVHVAWALAAGGRLGVGNDPRYNKTRCFDPFPFPTPDAGLKARLREAGEALDAHRKARLAEHPDLGMTGLYNVLDKLRAGEPLDAKDRAVNEAGLVSTLLDLHDRVDALTLEAYGWTDAPNEDAVLERLVALNAERAAEERDGLVRHLRPEFQAPRAGAARRADAELDLGVAAAAAAVAAGAKAAWPKELPGQMRAVEALLRAADAPLSLKAARGGFKGATPKRLDEVLQTLVAYGRARKVGDGVYAA